MDLFGIKNSYFYSYKYFKKHFKRLYSFVDINKVIYQLSIWIFITILLGKHAIEPFFDLWCIIMWECMLRFSILFSHFKKSCLTYHIMLQRLVYIKHHSVPLFNSLKILAIHEIFKIETLKFVFDCLSKNNLPQFNNYFI